MIKSAVAKLLTVKVAALAATVVGAGGVALAASTGTIPTPLHGNSAAASHRPDNDQGKPSDHPSGRSDQRDPAAVPSGVAPGLYWLCNDYIGRDADHRGKALGESKFRELADKAGGQDREKADKFCDKLLNDQPGSKPSSAPERTNTPNAHKPSQAAEPPANRPSVQPSTHPNR